MMRIDQWRSAAIAATALTAVFLAGCGGGEAEASGAPGGGPGGGQPPTPVDVAIAARDTAIQEIRATGEIEALQAIELRPDVEGRITEIYAREGREVGAGTQLFKVDDAELEAQVERLAAQRDLASQALERTRALIADNAASQSELEEAEARARSAEADLQLQQVRLERTVVRAPFGGVVGERLVSLGDYVTRSTPLLTLQTVNPHRASFAVPERYARELAEGQTVAFTVVALPDRRFSGTVDFVDPRVELPARTITVKARVANPDRLLQPGMFIEARLATEVRPDAVWVPEQAVLRLEQGTFVWVVEDGQAQRRDVQLGVREPGRAEILSGVSAGETVVVGGLERLFPGAPVMPREPTGDAANTPPPAGDAAAGAQQSEDTNSEASDSAEYESDG